MTTSNKEVPNVEPCGNCTSPDELVQLVDQVRPMEALLRKMAWTLWSITAPNRNKTAHPDTPPYELRTIVLAMREQDMRTARLGQVVGEAHQLLEKTLAEASGIVCGRAETDCGNCPRRDYLNSKGPALAELGSKLEVPVTGM